MLVKSAGVVWRRSEFFGVVFTCQHSKDTKDNVNKLGAVLASLSLVEKYCHQ